MKINLKYTIKNVDEIEKAKGMPIESCIADNTIGNLILFVQKGMIDENGVHGVSKQVAMDTIEKYIKEKDKEDLLLDIIESLCDAGFLPKAVDVKMMRKAKEEMSSELQKQIKNI